MSVARPALPRARVRRPRDVRQVPSARVRSRGTARDHDRAMDLATEETVLGDFNDAKFEYHGVTTRFFRRDGKFMVNTEGADGKHHDFEIKYTFGVRPAAAVHGRVPGRPRAGAARIVGREEQEVVLRHAAGRDRTSASCPAIRSIGPASLRIGTPRAPIAIRRTCRRITIPKTNTYQHDVAGDRRQLRRVPRAGQRARRRWPTRWSPFWDRNDRLRPAGAEETRTSTCRSKRAPSAIRGDTRSTRTSGRAAVVRSLRAGRCSPAAVPGRRPDSRRSLRIRLVPAEQDARQPRALHRLPRSAFAQAEVRGQQALHAVPHDPAKYDTPAHHHHAVGSTGAQCINCHMADRGRTW